MKTYNDNSLKQKIEVPMMQPLYMPFFFTITLASDDVYNSKYWYYHVSVWNNRSENFSNCQVLVKVADADKHTCAPEYMASSKL